MYRMFIPALIVLVSCARESTSVTGPSVNVAVDKRDQQLVINEYSPKSDMLNEFDEEADWIELYNPGTTDFKIEAGQVSVTDDQGEPGKYFLPAGVIPANGHLVIWWDGRDTQNRDIHSNFKLASNGEEIALFIGGELVDEVFFDEELKKSKSYGRTEDGAGEWCVFDSPSPGSSNQSFDNYAETLK